MAKIVFNEALISLGTSIIQQCANRQTLDELKAANYFLRAEVLVCQGINNFNFSTAQKLHVDIQREYAHIICEVSDYCVALERNLNIVPNSVQSLYDDIQNKLVFDQKCIVIDCLQKENKIKSLSEVILIQY